MGGLLHCLREKGRRLRGTMQHNWHRLPIQLYLWLHVPHHCILLQPGRLQSTGPSTQLHYKCVPHIKVLNQYNRLVYFLLSLTLSLPVQSHAVHRMCSCPSYLQRRWRFRGHLFEELRYTRRSPPMGPKRSTAATRLPCVPSLISPVTVCTVWWCGRATICSAIMPVYRTHGGQVHTTGQLDQYFPITYNLYTFTIIWGQTFT